jgi:hypothetical protein
MGACKQLNPDFVPADGSSSTDATTTSPTESTTFTASVADDASSMDDASDDTVGSSSSESAGDSSSGGDCDDVDGDNELPTDATPLDEQACEDEPATFDGVIVDGGDDDWLTLPVLYTGNFECGNDDPITSLALDDDALVVCGYLTCNDGQPMILDCGGGMEASAPDGEPGCCGSGSVQLTFNCAGSTDESGTILVRVSAEAPLDCASYQLTTDFVI